MYICVFCNASIITCCLYCLNISIFIIQINIAKLMLWINHIINTEYSYHWSKIFGQVKGAGVLRNFVPKFPTLLWKFHPLPLPHLYLLFILPGLVNEYQCLLEANLWWISVKDSHLHNTTETGAIKCHLHGPLGS